MATTKPLKIEFKKDVAIRDIMYTCDKIMTTIGNRIGETFDDEILYPALESNGGTLAGGVIAVEAKKLSSPLSLYLNGDVVGSVTFNGSENKVQLNNVIQKINGINITEIFDSDGFVQGSNKLGKTITDSTTGVKTIQGYIGDTKLSNLFEYDDYNTLIVKKSSEAEKIDDYRYIKMEGDLTGGLRTSLTSTSGVVTRDIHGSKFITTDDPEITTPIDDYSYIDAHLNVEQYIPTSNSLSYEWLNPTTNVFEFVTSMTPTVSSHLNAVTYFVYTVPDGIFSDITDDDHVFVAPNVTNIAEYTLYHDMHLVPVVETESGVKKIKVYCYTNSVVPNMLLVKIRRVGKINSLN